MLYDSVGKAILSPVLPPLMPRPPRVFLFSGGGSSSCFSLLSFSSYSSLSVSLLSPTLVDFRYGSTVRICYLSSSREIGASSCSCALDLIYILILNRFGMSVDADDDLMLVLHI
jgi:hypothetical protein